MGLSFRTDSVTAPDKRLDSNKERESRSPSGVRGHLKKFFTGKALVGSLVSGTASASIRPGDKQNVLVTGNPQSTALDSKPAEREITAQVAAEEHREGEKLSLVTRFETENHAGYVYLSSRSIFRCFYYNKKLCHMKLTAEAANTGFRWNYFMVTNKRTPFFNPEHFISQIAGAIISRAEQETEKGKPADAEAPALQVHGADGRAWEITITRADQHNHGGSEGPEIGSHAAHGHHPANHTGEEGQLNLNQIGAAGRPGFANFLGVYEIEVHTHAAGGHWIGQERGQGGESSHYGQGHPAHHSYYHSSHHHSSHDYSSHGHDKAHQSWHHHSPHHPDHPHESGHEDASELSLIGAVIMPGGTDFRGLFGVHSAGAHHQEHGGHAQGESHTWHGTRHATYAFSHAGTFDSHGIAGFSNAAEGEAWHENHAHMNPRAEAAALQGIGFRNHDSAHMSPLAEGLALPEPQKAPPEIPAFGQARKPIGVLKVASAAASLPNE